MFKFAFCFLVGNLALLVFESAQQALNLLPLCVLVLFIKYKYVSKWPAINWILFGVFWACVSVSLWNFISGSIIKTPRVAVVEGVVCNIPNYNHNRWRFDLCVQNIDGKALNILRNDRLRVVWGQYAISPEVPVKAGQSWRLSVKLRPVYARVNPAGFDYAKWLVANGFIGTASVKKTAELLPNTVGVASYHAWRQSLFDHFTKLTEGLSQSSIILALLMGERASIDSQQWQVIQSSGTAHLLAISGLHVGIAALWSYWIILFIFKQIPFLSLRFPAPKAARIGAIIGASSLVLLSGLGMPAQRALLMLFIYFITVNKAYHFRLLNVLGTALIAILLIHPFAVLSVSFWLSFSAVCIIALVSSRQWIDYNRLIAFIKMNGFIYLAMIPIGLMFFNQVSWVAIIANLILIPITSFITTPLIYLAALLVWPFEELAKLLFKMADQLLLLTLWIQESIASFNYDNFNLASNFWNIPILLLMFLVSLVPKRILLKIPIYVSLLILLIFSITREFFNFEQKDGSYFNMWVFDVGQGLAIYIETSEANLLYDTAWGNKDFAVANSVLMPFFKARNIQRINKVVLSHGDSDHAGGLAQVLDTVAVDELLSGEPLKSYTTSDCHQRPEWQWAKVKFKFLNSTRGMSYQGNNSSCVLSITINHNLNNQARLLLTGDIEKQVERNLLNEGIGEYQLVVAPHHGSKTSSTANFVKAIQPEHVIFSTGYDNHWKFPRQSVVARYQFVGSKIWITHEDGALNIRYDLQSGLKVSGLRHSEAKFWRNINQ